MTPKFLGREPALWLAAVQAVLAVAVGFGLELSGEQQALIYAALAALLGLAVRQQVTPVSDPHDKAGRTLVPMLPGVPYDDEPTTGSPDAGAVSWATVALLVIAAVLVLWAAGEVPR